MKLVLCPPEWEKVEVFLFLPSTDFKRALEYSSTHPPFFGKFLPIKQQKNVTAMHKPSQCSVDYRVHCTFYGKGCTVYNGMLGIWIRGGISLKHEFKECSEAKVISLYLSWITSISLRCYIWSKKYISY